MYQLIICLKGARKFYEYQMRTVTFKYDKIYGKTTFLYIYPAFQDILKKSYQYLKNSKTHI